MTQWRVIITEWALDTYLRLQASATFTPNDYKAIIRPDVELLKGALQDPRFGNSGFWGRATIGAVALARGHKMEWHNIGPGNVQLRLAGMVEPPIAYLCEAYVKSSPVTDMRMMARFQGHMSNIAAGRYQYRGDL